MITHTFSLVFTGTVPQIHLSRTHSNPVSFISTAQSDLAQVSTTGSFLLLNCFYFWCCLDDFLPIWHDDKKMDVFPFSWVLNLFLRYISLSSSLCIWIECIWIDLSFSTFWPQESFPDTFRHLSQMLFSTQVSFLFSSQQVSRSPTEKKRQHWEPRML